MPAKTGPLYTSPAQSTLTQRERFRRVIHFQQADHPVNMEFGWWEENFPAWQQQGMPKHVTNNWQGDKFFHLDTFAHVPIGVDINPSFTREVLEEHDQYQIVRDHEGVICQVFTDGSSSIPHFLKFPIETRADWERFRDEHLSLDVERYPANWAEEVTRLNASDRPVSLGVGSLWGRIRDWMGFENVCFAVADEPEFIAEIMDHLVKMVINTIDLALRDVTVDVGAFWEDMAYNAGPMVSPRYFREYLTPRYKEITDFCKHRGVHDFYVDCDGDPRLLIDGWLEGGVNIMFPLERAGFMDPVELREKYGEELVLFGGVDKTKLIAGRDAIDRELEHLAPVVAAGGFIPHVDHRCPPDVSYANYLYYLQRKCEVFGIPQPMDYAALRAEVE